MGHIRSVQPLQKNKEDYKGYGNICLIKNDIIIPQLKLNYVTYKVCKLISKIIEIGII